MKNKSKTHTKKEYKTIQGKNKQKIKQNRADCKSDLNKTELKKKKKPKAQQRQKKKSPLTIRLQTK